MRKQLFLQHASVLPGVTELHSLPPSHRASLWPMPETALPRDSIQAEVNLALDGILTGGSTRRDRCHDVSDEMVSPTNTNPREEEDGECDVHATGSGRHQVIGTRKSEPVRPLPPIPRRRSHRKHAQFASTRSKTRTHGRSRAMQMKDMRASIYETLRSLRHREKNRDSQRQRLHQREPLSIGRTTQTYNSIEQLLGSSSICPPDGSIPDLNAANVTSWTLDHFQGHFNDHVRQTSNMGAEPSPRIYNTRQQASPNRSIVAAPSTIIGNTRHSISSNSSKRTPSSIRVVNISDHNSNKRAPPSVRMADITRQASANSSMRAAPEKPFSDITYGLFPLPPPPELLLDIHNHSTLPVGHTLTDRQTASQTLVRPRPDYQPATRYLC